MNLTEEDKVKYNLIEDNYSGKIIGSANNLLNYIDDMIAYNLKNGASDEEVEQLKEVYKTIKDLDRNMIIAIFDNPMCGLDWQLVEYNYM